MCLMHARCLARTDLQRKLIQEAKAFGAGTILPKIVRTAI